MQEIKRKYVIPGDKIVEGNFRPLMNVIKTDNSIIATRIGIAETGRDGVKVIPLSGVYIPRVNDIVIGKIIDHSSLSWEVDVNSCFSAHLPAQDVFGRDFSPARDDMGRQLAIGDLIAARIIAFDRTRDPMLTRRSEHWMPCGIRLNERRRIDGTGNCEMVQRRKGLRLHRS